MTKLNQIIAIEKGVRGTVANTFTGIYHNFQKPALFAGLLKTYRPRDDEGQLLPSESQRVQLRVEDLLGEAAIALTRLFDVTASKDTTNQSAIADVVVDDYVVATGLSVSTPLFLEKQLTDLATVVSKIPTLDPGEEWTEDPNTDLMATTPRVTVRSAKVPRNHVKAAATDKHPAQVEVYYEDVPVGDWSTTKYSGAVSQARVNQLLGRIRKLQEAVKQAREEANVTEVVDMKIGRRIFDWLLAS
jgi:hypothetical protein